MQYASHEKLELLELTTFKTICLTKTKTMHALVSDEELKRLMQKDVQMTTRHLEVLSDILSDVAKQEETRLEPHN